MRTSLGKAFMIWSTVKWKAWFHVHCPMSSTHGPWPYFWSMDDMKLKRWLVTGDQGSHFGWGLQEAEGILAEPWTDCATAPEIGLVGNGLFTQIACRELPVSNFESQSWYPNIPILGPRELVNSVLNQLFLADIPVVVGCFACSSILSDPHPQLDGL